jgi:hypothetical protein
MLSNINQRLINRFYLFYEAWIIPPQNIGLLQIKKEEFKEKTKYLDPKVLYTLSEEEKRDLKEENYFVDLNEKTMKKLKNFTLSKNRHEGRYNSKKAYYNFALYQTKYYYADQNYTQFKGDYYFYHKIHRKRALIKKKLMYFSLFSAYLLWHHWRVTKITVRRRAEHYSNYLKDGN